MLRAFLLFPLLLALTGCSGEPSAKDMEKAVDRLISETIALTRQTGTEGTPVQVKDFEGFDGFSKIACAELADDRGYSCKFAYTATIAGKTESDEETGRFYQTEQGWVVELGTSGE